MMEDMVRKGYRILWVIVAVIPLISIPSGIVLKYILDDIRENGENILEITAKLGTMETNLTNKIVNTETKLVGQIHSVDTNVSTIATALGDSPDRIQRAAIVVLQAEQKFTEITARVETASSTIVNLETNLGNLAQQVQQLRDDFQSTQQELFNPETGVLFVEISAIRNELVSLREAMSDDK